MKVSRNLLKVKEEVSEAMLMFDVDSSGTLSFGEFLVMFATSKSFLFNKEGSLNKSHELNTINQESKATFALVGHSEIAEVAPELERKRLRETHAAGLIQGALRANERAL